MLTRIKDYISPFCPQAAKMLGKQVHRLGNKTFGYLITARRIQQNVNTAVSKQFTPVQIDVPWGKIEGKLWGSEDQQPMLAVHGWMDNAGSFDMLAPILKNHSVLAIDLPGHGLSSWLPRGVYYNEHLTAEAMRYVVKHFGWNKVKLLGHSMGGILCFNYARLFPQETQFVITIDSLGMVPSRVIKHSAKQAKAIDKLIEFEKKVTNDPPSYSEDVAIQKWIDAVKFSALDIPTTKQLMLRGAKRKDDGTVYYTRDFRLSLKGVESCYTPSDIKEIASLIDCPYMVVRASKSAFPAEYWVDVLEVLGKTSKDLHVVNLEGCHHVHMTNPELVATEITPFLEKHNT